MQPKCDIYHMYAYARSERGQAPSIAVEIDLTTSFQIDDCLVMPSTVQEHAMDRSIEREDMCTFRLASYSKSTLQLDCYNTSEIPPVSCPL